MTTDVTNLVSPSLHPGNLTSMPEYTDEVAPYLAPAVEALDDMYQSIAAVHRLKQVADKNQAWTPANVALQVSKEADKTLARLMKKADAVLANLQKSIDGREDMLRTPLQQRASVGAVNGEIRAHVKAMSAEERTKFLREANESGDGETLAAVLGAPPFLSGLTQTEKEHFTREYHMRRDPVAVRRLAAMKAAHKMLQDRAPLVFKELEKAVGVNAATVKKLREANTAAEQAFAMNAARNAQPS